MNVMDGLEKKLMPMAESVSENKYLLTMRDSFAMLMPILIIGSMFTLVGNLPIPAWVDFLKATTIQGKSLFSLLAIPSACTVSLMALFLAFNIGYNFADQLGLEDRVSAGMVYFDAPGNRVFASGGYSAVFGGEHSSCVDRRKGRVYSDYRGLFVSAYFWLCYQEELGHQDARGRSYVGFACI